MPKRNRATLRGFFSKGMLPTEKHFVDLIDSSLNMEDEGFTKTKKHGMHLSTLPGQENLLSFFKKDNEANQPLWTVGYVDEDNNGFSIYKLVDNKKSPVMSLSQDKNVGIQTEEPTAELEVNGFVKSSGRMGSTLKFQNDDVEEEGDNNLKPVLANRRWQAITPVLHGCNAFEVVAGVSSSENNIGKGQYALLHAIAMNTYNPTGFLFNFLNLKKRIKCSHAYYRSRAYALKLRWHAVGPKEDHAYQLEMRTNSNFIGKADKTGKDIYVNYHITKLWDEHYFSNTHKRAASRWD
jgi:hypothetical protein